MARTKYDTPVFKKDQPDDAFKFRPVPLPSGVYPYHLLLNDVVADVDNKQLCFHMVGDTGSLRNTDFQHWVAANMARQYQQATLPPQFLFHLGDVVYNYGEADNYDKQFFECYNQYPGPVFAIAGNHDADINPLMQNYQSLDAFRAVFCDTIARPIKFSAQTARKSNTQPHVYFTLITPLAHIIGLYSNVTKYGVITGDQRSWLIAELQTANLQRPGKALLICLHHAPYSADVNHGSSQVMIELLNAVFEETGITPDAVFSGHVHNYQRFSKQYAHGKTVPYIVAGGGGFDELHPVALKDDNHYTNESKLFKGVHLEHYCDDEHGFLKVSIVKTTGGLVLTSEYYTTTTDAQAEARLADQLILHI